MCHVIAVNCKKELRGRQKAHLYSLYNLYILAEVPWATMATDRQWSIWSSRWDNDHMIWKKCNTYYYMMGAELTKVDVTTGGRRRRLERLTRTTNGIWPRGDSNHTRGQRENETLWSCTVPQPKNWPAGWLGTHSQKMEVHAGCTTLLQRGTS